MELKEAHVRGAHGTWDGEGCSVGVTWREAPAHLKPGSGTTASFTGLNRCSPPRSSSNTSRAPVDCGKRRVMPLRGGRGRQVG